LIHMTLLAACFAIKILNASIRNYANRCNMFTNILNMIRTAA